MSIKHLTKERKDQLLSDKLFEAIENGDTELVKLYVDLGAPLEMVSKDCWKEYQFTPLLAAMDKVFDRKEASLEMVEYLLAKGSKVDARDSINRTALILAAYLGNELKAIELLLDYGADINAQDSDLMTPIMMAAGCEDIDFNHFKVFKFLYEKGVDLELENKNGDNVIDWIYKSDLNDFIEFLDSHNEQKALDGEISQENDQKEGLKF